MKNKKIFFYLLYLSMPFIHSCVLSSKVPAEEQYIRNYGSVERIEQNQQYQQVKGEEENNLITDFGGDDLTQNEDSLNNNIDTSEDSSNEDNTLPTDGVAIVGDSTSDANNKGDSGIEENTDTLKTGEEALTLAAVASSGESADNSPSTQQEGNLNSVTQSVPFEGIRFELPPTYDELEEPLIRKKWSNLEDRLFDMVNRSYQVRDASLFFLSVNKFRKSFPVSNKNEVIANYLNTFYPERKLILDYFNGSIFNLGKLKKDEYKILDVLFKEVAVAGFKYVLWKPYQNEADYNDINNTADDNFGALYKSNFIHSVGNYLPKVIDAAAKNNLKLLVSFPLRDHPWLKYQYPRLVDETWFPAANLEGNPSNFSSYPKLNLIHPMAEEYLTGVLQELIRNGVSGIVFENDFIHKQFEGFSELNLLIYEDEISPSDKKFFGRTNITPNPRKHFIGHIKNKSSNSYAASWQINSKRYKHYVDWRNNKINSLLTTVMHESRSLHPNLLLGLKSAPELINNKQNVLNLYGVAPEFFISMPINFIIHEKALYGVTEKQNTEDFIFSARYLRDNLPRKTTLFLAIDQGSDPYLSDMNREILEKEKLRTTLNADGFMLKGSKEFFSVK